MAERGGNSDHRTAIRVAGAVVGLAVLALGGIGVARAITRPADPNAALRTAMVSRGTVQQVLPLTGSVQQVEQVQATFPVSGTITAVNVSVGDRVQQGQVLATMDPLPLQSALLDARAQLAQAQAQLDSAQNPTLPPRPAGQPGLPAGGAGSAGGSSRAAGQPGLPTGAVGQPRLPQRPAGTGGAAQPPAHQAAPAQPPGQAAVPESVSRLPGAMTAMHQALEAQQRVCRPVLAAAAVIGSARPSEPPYAPAPPPAKRTPPSPVPPTTPEPTTPEPTTPEPTPSASATPTDSATTPQQSASPAHSPARTPTAIATPTVAPSPGPTARPTPEQADRPTPTPAGAPARQPRPVVPIPSEVPGPDQFIACADAMQQLAASQQQAATLIGQASAALQNRPAGAVPQQPALPPGQHAGGAPTGQLPTGQAPAGQAPAGQAPANLPGGQPSAGLPRGGPGAQPPVGSGASVPAAAAPTVDQARVASDRASVLAAQQAVAQAQSNLDAATLKAPIAGTVGAVGLGVGRPATPATAITLIGPGAAQVTVPVPLANRPQVQLGQQVRVNAPGALTADTGTVTEIAPLPISATAATPSYGVTVLVADPGPGLVTGGRADTGIVVGQIADAVTVPVSAVTRVATGSGTVRLIEPGGVREVNVGTGLVGNGLLEITDGLTAGQRVVLADSAQPLPTNQSLRNLRGGQPGGQSGGGGQGGGQQTPTAQPS